MEIDDDIEIFFQGDSDEMKEALEVHYDMIKDTVRKRYMSSEHKPHKYPEIGSA